MFVFRCEVFAVGNGVGCRETETYISSLIKENNLKMNYWYSMECFFKFVWLPIFILSLLFPISKMKKKLAWPPLLNIEHGTQTGPWMKH